MEGTSCHCSVKSMTCKVPTLVVTRKLISIFLHCFWQSHTKLFLCMYARVTLSSHVGDIIHFKVLFTVIMSMTRHFKTTTRRSNDKIYVCEVLHDKLFMMTSLLFSTHRVNSQRVRPSENSGNIWIQSKKTIPTDIIIPVRHK